MGAKWRSWLMIVIILIVVASYGAIKTGSMKALLGLITGLIIGYLWIFLRKRRIFNLSETWRKFNE
jgi:L-asparagine transporter-like permease